MLLKFSVSNFLSFDKKITFSMIPSLQKTNNENLIRLNGEIDVLRFGILYGANASGKSNFIKAFSSGIGIVLAGLTSRYQFDYCRNDDVNKSKISEFEYTFLANEQYYSYGFSAVCSEKRIVEEWLYSINPKNEKEKNIFLRTPSSESAKTVFKLPLSQEDSTRINTYLLDMKDNGSLLLLGVLRDKNFGSESKLGFIKDIIKWFSDLDISFADEPIDFLETIHEDNCSRVSDILSHFDTGISKVFFESITFEELQKRVNDDMVINHIKENAAKAEKEGEVSFEMMLRGNNLFYKINGKSLDSIQVSVIRLKHHNSRTIFDFNDESDGTRRLFDLLDILLTNKKNSVFLIDEIERSLHPVLLFKFFEMVKKELSNRNIQIIVTTHDTHILDQRLFRRDEIWFLEKDDTGASQLFSLDIFKERIDKNLSKNYLDGRYGGIPLFRKMVTDNAD